jgi:hypothetical protein
MENATVDLNHNYAECLKSIGHFGYTQYQNICTGEMSSVPWGVLDYLGAGILASILLLALGVLGLVIYIAAMSIKDGI